MPLVIILGTMDGLKSQGGLGKAGCLPLINSEISLFLTVLCLTVPQCAHAPKMFTHNGGTIRCDLR
ncbi:hypothetical protein ACU8KH_03395 [Lachancea thermotolerans]